MTEKYNVMFSSVDGAGYLSDPTPGSGHPPLIWENADEAIAEAERHQEKANTFFTEDVRQVKQFNPWGYVYFVLTDGYPSRRVHTARRI